METFGIQKLDVTKELEEEKRKKGGQTSSMRGESMRFEDSVVKASCAHFLKHVKADKHKMKYVSKIQEPRVTHDNFKKILTDLRYPTNNDELFY